jgi:hypothetical protein
MAKPRILSDQLSAWLQPQIPAVERALRDFQPLRPAELILTLKVKLVSPSRKREQAILDLQATKLRMRDALLVALTEDPRAETVRADGAFAHIATMLQGLADGSRKGSPVMALQNLLSSRFSEREGFTTADFRLTAAMRQAIFREVAIILWDFYQDALLEDKGTARGAEERIDIRAPRPAEEAFRTWAAKWRTYDKAALTVVPIGRHKNRTFAEAGKGNIRWLRGRVLEPDVLKKTLKGVAVLLGLVPYSRRELQEALCTPHPWRRHGKREAPPRGHRAPRASRVAQQVNEAAGKTITLGSIQGKKRELRLLYDELSEQQQLPERMERVRAAIDVFLAPHPPRYPQVEAPLTSDEREEAEWEHYRSLRAFRTPVHSAADDDLTKSSGEIAAELERWERGMTVDLLRAESELLPRRLQRLAFARSLRPNHYGAAGLLTDRRTGQYLLAMNLPGAQPAQNDGFLDFAAFPYSPFRPGPKVPITVFPLAYGREYHDERYLRQAVDQCRAAQEHEAALPKNEGKPIAECWPEETPIGPIELSTCRNAHGWVEIYAHIPVHVPVPPCAQIPTTVMGVHEEDNGRYSYVVVALVEQRLADGRCAKPGDVIACGDVVLPEWADPLQAKGLQPKKRSITDKPPPNNYAFEVASTISVLPQSTTRTSASRTRCGRRPR